MILRRFCAAWMRRLAETARGDFYAVDPTGEVFWTVWETEAEKRMLLLNTDWTAPGNEKPVTVHYRGNIISLPIREGTLAAVTVKDGEISAECIVLS